MGTEAPMSMTRPTATELLDKRRSTYWMDAGEVYAVLTLLAERVEAVLALHAPVRRGRRVVCESCGADGHGTEQSHPCPTVRLLNGEGL